MLTVPVQVCPVPAVTVTSVEPVTGVTPLLTVKLTVTFSGFVFGVVPVMVVVVAVASQSWTVPDSPCCRRWSGPRRFHRTSSRAAHHRHHVPLTVQTEAVVVVMVGVTPLSASSPP